MGKQLIFVIVTMDKTNRKKEGSTLLMEQLRNVNHLYEIKGVQVRVVMLIGCIDKEFSLEMLFCVK